jgi:hypothetical protein
MAEQSRLNKGVVLEENRVRNGKGGEGCVDVVNVRR